MVVEQEAFIHVLISLAILLFGAKIFAELFHKFKLPVVLGELLAGIIVSPFALGGIPLFDGKPLVILNETVLQVGELSGIVILFIAGLEITPREFLKGGAASFAVGACGVVVPFFVGYYVYSFWIGWITIRSCTHSTYGNKYCNLHSRTNRTRKNAN
jgi:Kef-type K+ transport system membrane component KefB